MRFYDVILSKYPSVKAFSDTCGVPYRSLEQYSSGRYPLSNMRAEAFAKVCDTLDIKPLELLEIVKQSNEDIK